MSFDKAFSMMEVESDHVRLQPLSIVILTNGKDPRAKRMSAQPTQLSHASRSHPLRGSASPGYLSRFAPMPLTGHGFAALQHDGSGERPRPPAALSIVILTNGKEPPAKPVRGADRYGGAAEYFAR